MIIGAEASIIFKEKEIIKERINKNYRVKELDESLIKSRTKKESNILKKLQGKINVPKIIYVNNNKIIMERIKGIELSEIINRNNYVEIGGKIGNIISKMHELNVIHGDLTTSNMILNDEKKIYLIDFGLSFISYKIEDKAVDLHLLHQIINAKHFKFKNFFEVIITEYQKQKIKNKKIINRLLIVKKRGRNKRKNNENNSLC